VPTRELGERCRDGLRKVETSAGVNGRKVAFGSRAAVQVDLQNEHICPCPCVRSRMITSFIMCKLSGSGTRFGEIEDAAPGDDPAGRDHRRQMGIRQR